MGTEAQQGAQQDAPAEAMTPLERGLALLERMPAPSSEAPASGESQSQGTDTDGLEGSEAAETAEATETLETASEASPAPKPGAEAGTEEPDDPIAAKVAEIAARIEAKKAEATAPPTPAAPAPPQVQQPRPRLDAALLRTAQGQQHLQQWAQAEGVDLLQLYDALSQLGEGGSEEHPLEQRLDALEQQQQRAAQQAEANARASQQAQARETFLAEANKESYPLLSTLSADEAVSQGIAAAQELVRAGVDADAEAIAAWAETRLRKLASKLAGRRERAAEGRSAQEQTTEGPKTLSGSIGGESPEPPALNLTEDGPRERGLAFLQRRGL